MASYPLVQQYLDEFRRCYPQKQVHVSSKLRDGAAQHRVYIDGLQGVTMAIIIWSDLFPDYDKRMLIMEESVHGHLSLWEHLGYLPFDLVPMERSIITAGLR